jgi:hypothetical protein
MTVVTKVSIDQFRQHRLLVIVSLVATLVALIASVVALFWGVAAGSAVASILAVPLGVISVLLALLALPPTNNAPQAEKEEKPEPVPAHAPQQEADTAVTGVSDVTTTTESVPSQKRGLIWAIRVVAVLAGLSSIVSAVVALNLLYPAPSSSSSESSPSYSLSSANYYYQPLLIDGPQPVRFDNGQTWKWLDLPQGETVVKFSPGGGPKNDALSELRGDISRAGNCVNSDVSWSFKGDGHFLGDDSTYYSSYDRVIPLPDHVDQIVLTIKVTYVQQEKCSLGLEWRDPNILRSKPLPEPSPSPS